MDRYALVDQLKRYEGTLRQMGVRTMMLLDRDPPEVVIEHEPRMKPSDVVRAEDMLTARTGIVLRCSTRAELPSLAPLSTALPVF